MADPLQVKRALRTLALGQTCEPGARSAAASIDEAIDAMADIHEAATFVEADGRQRVRQAIASAERHGHSDVAQRGRSVLATLRRYRLAADADHFHSGRGTVLGGNGQQADR